MEGYIYMDINEKIVNTFINLIRIRNDENEFQRIPLEAEKSLLNSIKDGAYENIKIHPFSKLESNMGQMAPNSMLHFQFATVSAITLFSRTAITAGVNPDDSFDLSDALLYYLAKANTPNDCHRIFQLAATMFAKKVHSIKTQNMPYHINKICVYISRNIFRKITIKEISNYVELSPNYMCNMFNSHMHITIHNYIQKEKIQIACNFLSQTDRPVTEISTYLGFKTISNFSVIFKKWIRISPTEYRNMEFNDVY